MRLVRTPVHHHGPSPPLRGRGHGPIHAQGDCGDLRGGPAVAAAHGAAASLGAGEQTHDRRSDATGPEGNYGAVRHREQRLAQ